MDELRSALGATDDLSADEQKLADRGHILDEKGDAWWRRIGYADSREEFLKFWTALRPEFREGPVPPPAPSAKARRNVQEHTAEARKQRASAVQDVKNGGGRGPAPAHSAEHNA